MLYLLNGFLFIGECRHESAKEEFQKGREICPDMFLYHSKLGSYYHLSDTLLQAEEHYLKAIDVRPEDTHTIRALSDVYEKLGKYVNQTFWLEKLIKIDPEFPNGRFDLGLAYMELGQFDRAISLFKRMQAQCPQDHRAKINEAICLRGIGEYEASIRLSLEIETAEKDELLVIVSNIAHCHVALGDCDQAIKWFDRLADINPEALEPPVYLSMLYMEQMNIEASVSQCSKLLSLLGMEQNMTLNRLVELGGLYFNVGCRLNAMKKEDLAGICFDIAAAFGYHNFKSRKEMERSYL